MKSIFNKIAQLKNKSADVFQQKVEQGKNALYALKEAGEASLDKAKEKITQTSRYNKVAKLFTTPERELHKELQKNIYFCDVKQQNYPTALDAMKAVLPSVEKVEALIAEGADLNKEINYSTPLIQCARNYGSMINSYSATGYLALYGHEMREEDCQMFADHYLKIAKILVAAGANPRFKLSGFNNDAKYYLFSGVREDRRASLKTFRDFLDRASKKWDRQNKRPTL